MKLINEFNNLNANGENEIWVQIERAQNEYTWMPKAVYEAQQVEHLTEIVPVSE